MPRSAAVSVLHNAVHALVRRTPRAVRSPGRSWCCRSWWCSSWWSQRSRSRPWTPAATPRTQARSHGGGGGRVGGRLPRRAAGARDAVARRTTLQPYAEEVRADTGVDFVVVMALDRTRFTHPDPDQIGEAVHRRPRAAPEGRVFTQEYTGTLGRSVRAVVPVLSDGQGRRARLGRHHARADRPAAARRPAADRARGRRARSPWELLGAWLISRRLRRQTHGMGEREITRMYEYYRAVLHAVREGLLLVDDAAARAAGQRRGPSAAVAARATSAGRSLAELGLPPGLVHAAASATRRERPDLRAGRARAGDQLGARLLERPRASAPSITLRDRTELQAGHRRARPGARPSPSRCARRTTRRPTGCTRSCRSSRWASRERGRRASPPRSSGSPRPSTDQVVGAVREPVLAALLLGKSAQAAERGIELVIEGDVDIDELAVARARPGHRGRQPRRQRHRMPSGADGPARRARSASTSSGDADGLDVVVGRQRSRRTARGRGPRPRARLVDQGLGRPWARARARRAGGAGSTAAAIDVGSSSLGGAEVPRPARSDLARCPS